MRFLLCIYSPTTLTTSNLLIYSGKISEKKLLGDDYQIKMLNLEIKKSNNE